MSDGSTTECAQTFRGFWHGSALGPYQLMCLRSFVASGHYVEVFSYDRNLVVPDWITRRDAREIVENDHVLHYRPTLGMGAGTPALHANLFRYAMLHQLGGWWIDLDVVLLYPNPPPNEIFIVFDPQPQPLIGNAVLQFPRGHALLAEAVERCVALGENVTFWGQTGPSLITELAQKYGLSRSCRPMQVACAVNQPDFVDLFDPVRCDEIRQRCASSWFFHLTHEVWREAGIPRDLGPPNGSFLDWLCSRHDFGVKFRERMEPGAVARWIGNRNQRIDLEHRNKELERKYCDVATQRDALLSSTSWRLMAPLRKATDWVRRNTS